jgi:pyridinium-3,5-biscarboxylic acid mononucleotide sulfurtransferase
VEAGDFARLLEQRSAILTAFKEFGYLYVTLDLNGFRSGSMNDVLGQHGHG